MSALPGWMRPPRAEGWFAEDLDRLPEAPRHTELIDGALVFMVSPQRWWHGHLVTMLTVALMEQVPADTRVGREMTIKLDQRNRPEPDLLVTTAEESRSHRARWARECLPQSPLQGLGRSAPGSAVTLGRSEGEVGADSIRWARPSSRCEHREARPPRPSGARTGALQAGRTTDG
ncbi:Uma2 family endonuclease [Streptomyces sp. NPDC091371]|uniref:Uma2 family endonuclease n=1 Tax=Streptomyces sp. NPDC091371 TaxID=3155303 RepID=UPI00341A32F0